MDYCEDCSSYDCGCAERKEIASLRQQLAEKDQTILDHVEIQQALRQQLAEREKQIVMLHSCLKRWAFTHSKDECDHMEVAEALDATEPKP